MIHAVSCPKCRNLSRIGAETIGQVVSCPHCAHTFPAIPDPGYAPVSRSQPPVARRVKRQSNSQSSGPIPVATRVRRDDHVHELHDEPHHGPSAALIALVLLPLGIPLLWVIGPQATGIEPIFSFAAPVALAVCVCGLGMGVGFAHGWNHTTRIKAVLALVMLAYFSGGFLYFMKKEWAEALRKHVGPGPMKWQDFQPPHDKKAYTVKLPGRPKEAGDERTMPGWGLKVYRYAPDPNATKNALELAYEVAHGTPPVEAIRSTASDEDWFSAARKSIQKSCDGEVTREREIRHKQEHPGREFALVLPDGSTNRIVRIYRVQDQVFYLSVEGAFVSDDAFYVRDFFESFLVTPR